MVVSEASRHALYAELEHLLGTELADTLMTSLPMEQADQPATKTDVDRLETRFDRLEARFDVLEARFDRIEERFDAFAAEIRGEVREMHALMHDQFRNYTITMVGAMTGLTAIFGVIVGVLG
ncbi:MAG: hypothetical protein ACC658_04660 [Acidimicrobiia bacterium]